MAKFYFDIKKYKEFLFQEDVSESLMKLFVRCDSKNDGKEVVFIHNLDDWGIIKDTSTFVRREWCTKERNRVENWIYKNMFRFHDINNI